MLFVLLGVLVVIAIFFVSTYNGLVVARNKVRDQFSQIDVQLKKRTNISTGPLPLHQNQYTLLL